MFAAAHLAIARLAAAGVAVGGPPFTAGTFLRFVTVHDPAGNRASHCRNISAIRSLLRDRRPRTRAKMPVAPAAWARLSARLAPGRR